MAHHYTEPSRLLRLGYRYLYDPLRAGYLRGLVASLELAGSERVLDVGSGPGSEGAHLARSLDRGGQLVCLDVSPTWLAEARRRLAGFANVTFIEGEAPAVGLPDGGFDLILAHYVLHDIDPAALPATLRALARALDPGGRFVVVEPTSAHHGPSVDVLAGEIERAGLTGIRRESIRGFLGSAIRLTFKHP